MSTNVEETQTLEHAAALLRGTPWAWTVTVEYPGYLEITFDNGDGTRRYYHAGYANPTLTVERLNADGMACEQCIDTRVAVASLDGYRLALHTAAAIDRLEHEGEPLPYEVYIIAAHGREIIAETKTAAEALDEANRLLALHGTKGVQINRR